MNVYGYLLNLTGYSQSEAASMMGWHRQYWHRKMQSSSWEKEITRLLDGGFRKKDIKQAINQWLDNEEF